MNREKLSTLSDAPLPFTSGKPVSSPRRPRTLGKPSGRVDDGSATPGVRFTVDARRLSVKPEKGVSDEDQAEVQSDMQSKVLESSAYPEIVFHSTQVRRTSDRDWKVSGDLTLHGATRPVIVDVTRESDAYVGAVRIKQTVSR